MSKPLDYIKLDHTTPSEGDLTSPPDQPHPSKQTPAKASWGIVHIKEGTLRFCDIKTNKERLLSKEEQMVITPDRAHHIKLNGQADFYITFYC